MNHTILKNENRTFPRVLSSLVFIGNHTIKYDIKKCKLSVMDKWILSKLNSLAKSVDESLERYEIFESSRAVADFVDILSNWYVRRGRERYWGKDMTDDKASAYTTLYTVLVTLAKLTAPYTPFVSEMIYQNLVPSFYKDAPFKRSPLQVPRSGRKVYR